MKTEYFASPRTSLLRRRRRFFAGAEPLESRAMLSAVTADLATSFASVVELTSDMPPVAAEVINVETPDNRAVSDEPVESWFEPDVSLGFEAPLMRLGSNLDAFLSVASLGAAAVPSSPSARLAPFSDLSSSDRMSESSAADVEVKVASTGQVLGSGTTSALRDSNGLSVSDSHGPATYLQTTDSDGRVQSRLVFLTRAPAFIPTAEPAAPIVPPGAIIADAELSEASLPEGTESRADLHDLATALDRSAAEATSSAGDSSNATILAANGIVRTSVLERSTNGDSHSAASSNSDSPNDNSSIESVESARAIRRDDETETSLPSWPVFDSTTRNVILSACLLGALARASARSRRRQRLATEAT